MCQVVVFDKRCPCQQLGCPQRDAATEKDNPGHLFSTWNSNAYDWCAEYMLTVSPETLLTARVPSCPSGIVENHHDKWLQGRCDTCKTTCGEPERNFF